MSLFPDIFQEATKDHFWHDHFDFLVPGGAPRTLFIPLKGALATLFSWLVTENPSREVATKDHFASNPRKWNPPDLKTKVDVSKVDVKGFPNFEDAKSIKNTSQLSGPVLRHTARLSQRYPPLSGPLNRLNAILFLLEPLDRYRTPLCDKEVRLGGPYVAVSRIQTQVGVLNHFVLNRLVGSTARQWRYSV